MEGTRSLVLLSGLSHPFWCEASQAFCIPRNAPVRVDCQKTLRFVRHGVGIWGYLVPWGAAIQYNTGPQKGKGAAQMLAPRTVRGILAWCHLHSGILRNGVSLAYDEDSLKSAKSWHRLMLYRSRELILFVGGEFIFPATSNAFCNNFGTMDVGILGAPQSATSAQEAPPPTDDVVEDC